LGSIAGWAVNLPLALIGGTYLAVNVGGTLVPLLLIAWWIKKRKLPILWTLLGTALVTIVAWRIVEFHPDTGIVAKYPTFFLPIVTALLFGLLVSIRKPRRSVPIAYASGTLGALIGADLLHIPDIRQHFASAPENTIISIGGAGVFDMVFLAGTLAMAMNLAIVVTLASKRVPIERPLAYPARHPVAFDDARRLYARYQALQSPNAYERALAGLALSDIALKDTEYGKSVRMSWLAVDSLLQTEPLRIYLNTGAETDLRHDVEALGRQYIQARTVKQTLREAGEANVTAKTLVAVLAPRTGLANHLEAAP
ncbi:MAG: DUF1614 domain-containing protein, partial [Candidatus Thermoplasmatota archaeon]